ncbi:MAG: TetR/AcrR family transcriptional regulator [Bacteroidetes bacterium]|nr:TetR/AcrR family transcriptional regulator [Bacteroidales bacterium]NJO68348.1 TetR/AcrR family transcriptional regulator [Bacteroidota bacterium]
MSVTREKIMELGEDLIRTRGYNAFSYQDISSELGIKNAAIHYYFPSKENLGTSIVKTNIQRFEEMIQNMDNKGLDEMHQLESFMKIYAKSNREEKLCIVGSLGPNIESLNEPTRIELKRMTEIIISWLTGLLNSGREKGIFAFRGEAHERALLILSSLVAGLQLARILDKTDFKIIYQAILDGLKF